jgi:GAF domain-containing protein
MRTAQTYLRDTGAHIWGTINGGSQVLTYWRAGRELHRLSPLADEELAFSRQVGHRAHTDAMLACRQAVRCLRGWTRSPTSFDDAEFDEADFAARTARDVAYAHGVYRLLKLQVAFVMRDLDVAVAQVEGLMNDWALAPLLEIERAYLTALTLIAVARASGDTRGSGRLAPFERALHQWAEAHPGNFGHMHALVAAELAVLEERHADAEPLFRQAIAGAEREGFIQDQAIAEECLARHHLARGQRHLAGQHFKAANDAYARWGATAKVAQLDRELSQLRLLTAPRPPTPVTPSREASDLDVLTLLRAAETLFSEVVLDRLLEQCMRLCVEAAGAERAILLLEEHDQPVVRALGTASGTITLTQTPLAQGAELSLALVAAVRARREIIALAHAAEAPELASDPHIAQHNVKSLLGVPIERGNRLVGMLYFENNLATGVFHPERVRLLALLATEIAIALENSLRFEARLRSAATARFVADASALLAESLDYDVTLAKVARLAVPFLADACTIDVVEGARVRRVAGVHANPTRQWTLDELARRYPPERESQQPASHVLRSGESILIEAISDEALTRFACDADHLRLCRALAARSLIAVPLTVLGKIVGALTLITTQPTRRYDTTDLATAQDLAQRAALALENARLYREAQAGVHSRDKQLARTTRRLRSLARLQAGASALAPEELDLVAVVRAAVEPFQRLGSALVLRGAGPLVGRWDRHGLEDTVTNLVENAIAFGDSKPIEIVVDGTEQRGRLVVIDQGIGIAAERLPHLFELHDVETAGRGLGLFLVHATVTAMGGTVRAESGLHQGARFTVELPSLR